MIDAKDQTKAAYSTFLGDMRESNIPTQDTNMNIDKFWQHEWENRQDDYRAQAQAAFRAVGLEVRPGATEAL
jgi:hypothetical protein